MNEQIIQAILYTLPSIASGFVAFYFFKEYGKSDVGLQKFTLLNVNLLESVHTGFKNL